MRKLATLAIVAILVNSSSLFAADKPLKVAMYSGSAEYNSKESLTGLQKLLEERLGAKCTLNIVEEKGTNLNGVDDLETADVAIFFTRRVNVSDEQLAKVRKFIASGKGVIGIRTASHGFQTWLEFDAQIVGGSYKGHSKKLLPVAVALDEKSKEHAVLKGVKPFVATGTLYYNPTVVPDAAILLRGKTDEAEEKVAWTRDAKAGERGRVFYTSLGTAKDFAEPDFQQLLMNAVAWCSGRQN